MKNKDMVYKSLQIIEENLKSDINVYSVSQQFGFSFYYFSRLFKGVTGYTLKDYILFRKISESYKDILNSGKRILDIAIDYGFSTNESFSRSFNKIIGINPSQVRKQPDAKPANLVSPLTKEKIECIKKNSNQEPEIIKLKEIKLIGIPFYFDLTVLNDLSKPWNNLMSNLSIINKKVAPEKFYQVQYWFENQEPDLFYFFVAVQVEQIDDIPIQFTAKTIPEQKYLKFFHKGKSNTVGLTYQYIYDTYLPETNYRLPHLYNFEYYGDSFNGPCNEESASEIYIPFE